MATRPRVVTRRAAVLAAGALARAGALRAHTVWPSASEPSFIVEAGHRQGAAFVRRAFEPASRPIARLAPAVWNVLRARALVLRGDGGLAVAAAERALGRPLRSPRVAAFSPTGAGTQKITCFVFERHAEEPIAVVKAAGDPAHAGRLQAEADVIARLRGRLAGAPRVAEALPLEPLFAGECRGDYVIVEPLDPAAAGTGRADRARALAWLRAFHDETTSGVAPWDHADERAALAALDAAWRHRGPDEHDAVARRVTDLLAAVRGARLPRCAVHGDFWRGNVAVAGDGLRVYDWEWARLDGRPLMDIWTYELAELRAAAQDGHRDDALRDGIGESLVRVEAELEERGLDPRLARATLAPALGELSFRLRAATGRPGGNEAGALRLMGVVAAMIEAG